MSTPNLLIFLLLSFLPSIKQIYKRLGKTESRCHGGDYTRLQSGRVFWCERAYDPTQLNWSKSEMFRIWRTDENCSSLVVSVFTPTDATQRNRLVESRLLVRTRLRRDASRRISTEQFCCVALLGVNTSTTRRNRAVLLSCVAALGVNPP